MFPRSFMMLVLMAGLFGLPASSTGQVKIDPKNPKVDPKKKVEPKKPLRKWDLDSFVKDVAAKPPEEQVKAVTARLRELNSAFKDLQFARIEGGAVTKVGVDTYFVEDISPLRAFEKMTELYASSNRHAEGKVSDVSCLAGRNLVVLELNHNTELADLAVLKGMPLRSLSFQYTAVDSLGPVESCATLEELRFSRSRVTNLKPLKGLKLKVLLAGYTKGEQGQTIADLAPLQGMMLQTLHLGGASATNFAVLKPMPIEELALGDTPIADFGVLRDMPLKSHELARTKFSEKDALIYKSKPIKDLNLTQTPIKDLNFVKDMPLERLHCYSCQQVKDLAPLKDKKLKRIDMSYTAIKDLKPLAGMPLTHLDCVDTLVTSLEPLKGLPLTILNCSWTAKKGTSPLADLKPLAGMPLTYLNISNTAVKDLKPLAGTPVHTLYCQGTKVTDFAVLKDAAKLYTLYCDHQLPRDAAALRQIPSLRMLNGKNAQNLLN